MPKKFKSVNTKVEAANERKSAAKAQKHAKEMEEMEKQMKKEWSIGADQRGISKREQMEKKKKEADEKLSLKKQLMKEEEEAMSKIKTTRSATKKTKAQKDMDKPWEAALKPVVKKNNKGSRFKTPPPPPTSTKKAETEAENEKLVKKGIQPQQALMENMNREQADTGARNIDEAINMLSGGKGEAERHPERRAKAAYKKFEETMMEKLKEDYPNLKRSQYKEKLSELWRKSPENPLNQEHIAYNHKK